MRDIKRFRCMKCNKLYMDTKDIYSISMSVSHGRWIEEDGVLKMVWCNGELIRDDVYVSYTEGEVVK